jgi:hypothetical protein
MKTIKDLIKLLEKIEENKQNYSVIQALEDGFCCWDVEGHLTKLYIVANEEIFPQSSETNIENKKCYIKLLYKNNRINWLCKSKTTLDQVTFVNKIY